MEKSWTRSDDAEVLPLFHIPYPLFHVTDPRYAVTAAGEVRYHSIVFFRPSSNETIGW